MKAIQIKKDIYWVGVKDWNLREFHGYTTPRGSTYNAYLIMDEKITLVDGVKHHLSQENLSRIQSIIDFSKIDYLVVNHVEMDHSGNIPDIMRRAPQAKIITNNAGKMAIKYDVPLLIRICLPPRRISQVHMSVNSTSTSKLFLD